MNLHARTLSSSIKSITATTSIKSHVLNFSLSSANLRNMVDPSSVLPEQILVAIISLLSFQDAARTCVLSRNWRHTWRGTRNVEFNERFFSYVGEDEDARRIEFVNFIVNWMGNAQPATDLDKFSITVSRPVDFLLLMEQCVRFAVQRGVKVLMLDFSDPSWGDEVLLGNLPGPAFVLPQFLYGHGVLESLTLSSCFFNVAEMINFGLLKNLVLGWIELPLQTLNVLLVKLPLLESLTLKNCWNSTGLRVVGDELRLKSFVVDKIIMFENPWIEIEAPNLKYLKYSGIMTVFEIAAAQLEEAHFEFGLESEGDGAVGDRLYQLLNQVHAGILTVCTYMLQVLPHEWISDGIVPMFAVAHLRLKTAMLSCEQEGIQYLLRSCPFLMALTVQIVPERIVAIDGDDPDNVGDIWTRPYAPNYDCLIQTLKVVQVRGYRGTTHEVRFVKYLISRARVIEQLHILIGEELLNQRSFAENRRLITQTFLGVRKASNNLRVRVFQR